MGMAFIMSVVVTIGTYIFILFMYLVFCTLTTLFKNIGKDKFQWYGYYILATRPSTVQFESFGKLFKAGVIDDAKLCVVVYILALGACVYATLT